MNAAPESSAAESQGGESVPQDVDGSVLQAAENEAVPFEKNKRHCTKVH